MAPCECPHNPYPQLPPPLSMQIILMRHGKPELSPSSWISAAEMKTWIERYDHASIESSDAPPACLTLADPSTTVITSTLPRAQSSAAALGITAYEPDEIFCEAGLPFAPWQFLRLPPHMWALLFRVCWLLGYSRGSESRQEAEQRARKGAEKLVAIAEQKGAVLLIGHGIMNRLIARQLLSMGWSASSTTGGSYWNTRIYTRKTYTKNMNEKNEPQKSDT